MTQINAPQNLDGIMLLTALTDDARAALAGRCMWRTCAKGEQIVARDEADTGVCFVVVGTVGIVNYSLGGREVAYTRVDAGGYFGEMAAIDNAPRSATGVAKSPATLAVLPGGAFLDLLRDHPDVALAVMRKLTGIIRRSDDRIMDLSTLGAQARVCRELLRLAEDQGGDARDDDQAVIATLPTQADIASLAGTTRETVARTLGDLGRGGLIDRHGTRLVVTDRAALEDVADEWDG